MNQTREDKVAATTARMAELAAKFIERSGREIASMRGELAKLDAGGIEALGEIGHLAHRMCGTGATLGFGALADCAARIEQIATSCPAGGLPDAPARTRLGEGVEALAVELARLDADSKRPART
jgi:HPt (histidine-containing phosphotransfer) domain-containing protein